MGVQVYLLLHDVAVLNPPERSTPFVRGETVAELVEKEKDVLLQAPGDLVWENAAGGASLMQDQTLMTREGARAEVAFTDGSGVIVGENSLLRLGRSALTDQGGMISVSLLRGSLRSRRGREGAPSRMEVNIGSTQVRFDSDAELTIVSSPESVGGAAVTVQSGNVEVQAGAERLVATAGEEVLIPSEKEAKAPVVRKPATLPVHPPEGSAFRSPANESSVRFEWKSEEPLESHLEISTDPAFARDVRRHPVAAGVSQVEVKLPVPAGGSKWYWRVQPRGGKAEREPSTASSFHVSQAAPPSPLYPPDLSAFPPGDAVDFIWSGPDEAGAFEFEIRPERGAGKAIRRKLATNRERITDLPKGSFVWTVRAVYPDDVTSAWAPTRTISIVEKVKPPPPPPAVLFNPKFAPKPTGKGDQSALGRERIWSFLAWLGSHLIASAEADETVDNTWSVRLHWQEVPGAKGYRVQIARTRSFRNLISEADVNDPSYNWVYQRGMENSKGRVFYRVASMNEIGELGEFSAAMAIPIPKEILSPPKSKGSKVVVHASTERPVGAAPVSAATIRGGPRSSAAGPHIDQDETPDEEPAPPSLPRKWSGTAALHTGLGNASQSSAAADLTSVSTDGAFLQQKLGATLRMNQGERTWLGVLELSAAGFGRPSGRPTLQQEISAISWRVSAVRDVTFHWMGAWRTYFGAVIAHPYRWTKTGVQSVAASGGFSLGPALRVGRTWRADGFLPASLDFALALPLTGPLMGGPLGVSLSAGAEWHLLDLWQSPDPKGLPQPDGVDQRVSWLGLRIEAEISYSRWSAPTGTGWTDWAAWIAPVFHFNED